jgi:hypothetical protein
VPQRQARVDDDGAFTLTGIVPGRYRLTTAGTMRSSVVNGQDSLDFPVEVDGSRDIAGAVITLTSQTTELAGSVTNRVGEPAPAYTVVIAPADRRFWVPGARRVQTTRPASDGRYVFRNLPAGAYLLAAVTDIEPGGQFDPSFLEALARAALPVTIGDGGRHTQDIRVTR